MDVFESWNTLILLKFALAQIVTRKLLLTILLQKKTNSLFAHIEISSRLGLGFRLNFYKTLFNCLVCFCPLVSWLEWDTLLSVLLLGLMILAHFDQVWILEARKLWIFISAEMITVCDETCYDRRSRFTDILKIDFSSIINELSLIVQIHDSSCTIEQSKHISLIAFSLANDFLKPTQREFFLWLSRILFPLHPHYLVNDLGIVLAQFIEELVICLWKHRF